MLRRLTSGAGLGSGTMGAGAGEDEEAQLPEPPVPMGGPVAEANAAAEEGADGRGRGDDEATAEPQQQHEEPTLGEPIREDTGGGASSAGGDAAPVAPAPSTSAATATMTSGEAPPSPSPTSSLAASERFVDEATLVHPESAAAMPPIVPSDEANKPFVGTSASPVTMSTPLNTAAAAAAAAATTTTTVAGGGTGAAAFGMEPVELPPPAVPFGVATPTTTTASSADYLTGGGTATATRVTHAPSSSSSVSNNNPSGTRKPPRQTSPPTGQKSAPGPKRNPATNATATAAAGPGSSNRHHHHHEDETFITTMARAANPVQMWRAVKCSLSGFVNAVALVMTLTYGVSLAAFCITGFVMGSRALNLSDAAINVTAANIARNTTGLTAAQLCEAESWAGMWMLVFGVIVLLVYLALGYDLFVSKEPSALTLALWTILMGWTFYGFFQFVITSAPLVQACSWGASIAMYVITSVSLWGGIAAVLFELGGLFLAEWEEGKFGGPAPDITEGVYVDEETEAARAAAGSDPRTPRGSNLSRDKRASTTGMSPSTGPVPASELDGGSAVRRSRSRGQSGAAAGVAPSPRLGPSSSADGSSAAAADGSGSLSRNRGGSGALPPSIPEDRVLQIT